jgi:hypothetical protein
MNISDVVRKYCIVGGSQETRDNKLLKIKEDNLKLIKNSILRFDVYDLYILNKWHDDYIINNCVIIIVPNLDMIPDHHISSFIEIYTL